MVVSLNRPPRFNRSGAIRSALSTATTERSGRDGVDLHTTWQQRIPAKRCCRGPTRFGLTQIGGSLSA